MAAWVGAAGGLLLDARWVVVAGVAGIGCLVCRPSVRAAAVVFLSTLAIAAASAASLAGSALSTLADQKAVVRVSARIESDPQIYPSKGGMPARARVNATVLEVVGRGELTRQRTPITLVASGDLLDDMSELEAGTVVTGQVRLAPARRHEPVAGVGTLRQVPTVVSQPAGLTRMTNVVRGGLRDAMRFSTAEQAGLVPSLVVGDTSRLDSSLADDFKATGLTHLTAVSGTNLTLMLGFLTAVCAWSGIVRWARRAVQVFGVIAFVLVCRGEPSVLRAASMGIVGLAALGGARAGPRAVRHLLATVIVLCVVDPWLALSWGFGLSVAACVGILGWGARWQQTMRRWAPGWLAEAIAIPLAAQVTTQPLVIALSGQISLVGVVANALAGPFVGPVTVLGLIAAVLSWLPGLSGFIGWLAGWCVQPIVWIAQLGASTPMGVREVPKAGWVFALVGCVLIGVSLGWVLARPAATVALIVSLVVSSVWRPPTLGWPGEWRIVSCDVGQGDATVIRAGPHSAMLVDAGPPEGDVAGCLRSLRVRHVPVLVLTHFHADHVGGAEQVIDRFHVSTVVVSAVDSPAARRLRRSAAEHGATFHQSAVGEVITSGSASWRTVGAAPLVGTTQAEGESSAENDASLIGVASSDDVSMLIAGDAEPAGQQVALATGESLRADVLKLPHHGSSRQDERFFAATGARLAVASAGRDNSYGHPAARTVDLAEGLGMRTFRTDLQGAIAVTRAGGSIQVRVQRGPKHAR